MTKQETKSQSGGFGAMMFLSKAKRKVAMKKALSTRQREEEAAKAIALKELSATLTESDRALVSDWLSLAQDKISRQNRKRTKQLRKKREQKILNQFGGNASSEDL
mmetsp:Transcript_5268/g.8264  ORF Transcript_5268/g.8264 Transcript_5268/m.8264 type:complete len:106 (-) Transcript_5268:64-381(-)